MACEMLDIAACVRHIAPLCMRHATPSCMRHAAPAPVQQKSWTNAKRTADAGQVPSVVEGLRAQVLQRPKATKRDDPACKRWQRVGAGALDRCRQSCAPCSASCAAVRPAASGRSAALDPCPHQNRKFKETRGSTSFWAQVKGQAKPARGTEVKPGMARISTDQRVVVLCPRQGYP
jgi:hypothetical protein